MHSLHGEIHSIPLARLNTFFFLLRKKKIFLYERSTTKPIGRNKYNWCFHLLGAVKDLSKTNIKKNHHTNLFHACYIIKEYPNHFLLIFLSMMTKASHTQKKKKKWVEFLCSIKDVVFPIVFCLEKGYVLAVNHYSGFSSQN